jgi:hypothetical protein
VSFEAWENINVFMAQKILIFKGYQKSRIFEDLSSAFFTIIFISREG